jgi:hypothetical protein
VSSLFTSSESPQFAIRIPGCEDFVVRDTDGDGDIDSKDETVGEAKEDAEAVGEEISDEIASSHVVQDVQTTISCDFLAPRRCKRGKVAFCAFDYDTDECNVNCTAINKYKCRTQNPVGYVTKRFLVSFHLSCLLPQLPALARVPRSAALPLTQNQSARVHFGELFLQLPLAAKHRDMRL